MRGKSSDNRPAERMLSCLERSLADPQGVLLSSDGFPSLGIFQIILDPSLYWPIFDQFNSPGGPLTVFKGNVAPFPFPLQLLGHYCSCTRSKKRVNHEVTDACTCANNF